MVAKELVLDESRNVTLTAYLQAVGGKFDYVPRRPAVLILPGGGYQYCSDREADPVAFAYLKAGYQAFILRYSVGADAAWPMPLMDVDQAMGMIRENADAWGVYPERIAVIGFSAGGHLAAASATMGAQRPNAAILGYAVSGKDVKSCNLSAPDCNAMVDAHTCPCFIFAARDDGLVPVMNSIGFMQALAEHGVTFESHIYSYGGHGFSTAENSVQNPGSPRSGRVKNWVEDSIGWLGEIFGVYDGEGGMTEPLVKGHVSGDYEPTLSVDCTMGKLYAVPDSRAVIEPIMNSMRVDSSSDEALSGEEADETIEAIRSMTFRNILGFAGAPDSAIAKLDEKLRAIANPETA